MVRTTRENVLEAQSSMAHLSTHGRDWLIAATDPFHDYDLELAGYPDISSESTIVQCVKKSLTITTRGAAGSGNWDANIVMTPFMSPMLLSTASVTDNGVLLVVNGPTTEFGGLVVSQTLGTNVPTFPFENGANKSITSLFPDPDYMSGYSRIISMGFEVANTTAEIYRQGAVAVYESPSHSTNSTYYVGETGFSQAIPVESFSSPPAFLEEALLLQGTRQWEAREGNYNVSKLSSIENPILTPTNTPKIIRPAFDSADSIVNNPVMVDTIGLVASGGYSNFGGAYNKNVPYNYSGAFYTGLSEQTTLTITCRWYIERAPTFKDKQLVVLATPSPGIDMDALYLYSKVMREIPCGVMLKENGLGDFFKKVLNVIKKIAKPVFTTIGKIASPAGMIADTLYPGSGRVVTTLARGLGQVGQIIPQRQRRRGRKINYESGIVIPQNMQIMPIKATNKLPPSFQMSNNRR